MTSARPFWFLPCAIGALAVVGAGCAQSNPLISHRATLGSLKTSVSQLEFENQQLKQKVANLDSESRQIEDRLVQEESINGDLRARLDDAKALLSRRGLGPDGSDAAVDSDPFAPRRTLPAGRSNRKTRKPPFAQIPGRVETEPPADEQEDDVPNSSSKRWRGDPGPQSRRDDPAVWLPVARGATDLSTPRR
jgi:hypothetical protein